MSGASAHRGGRVSVFRNLWELDCPNGVLGGLTVEDAFVLSIGKLGADQARYYLDQAKGRGVTDVAFHKKRGLAVADMTKSPWVYRKLRNFRAGIEAGISCFKRAYGGARCTWRGLDHFKAYVWSAVVAHNLVLFARLKPA